MSSLAKNEMCYVYQSGARIFSIAFSAHGKLEQYQLFTAAIDVRGLLKREDGK